MRRCLVIILLGACASSAPVPTMPVPQPPAPASAVTLATAPTVTLGRDQRLTLGGGVTVHFNDLIVEEIAASPDGHYPGGSGITLALIFEGLGAPARREISLLSAGYDSVREAWFDHYRVTVVDVKDPLGDPQLAVIAERIGDRVRADASIAVRVERGAEIALGTATMTFHGHSSKHTREGEQSPLMVAAEYRAPGAPPERFERNVGTEDRPQRWSWRDYRFTIDSHAYDEWMQLSIERLELEPI